MNIQNLIGEAFLIGAMAEAVFTKAEIIDHRFLLTEVRIINMNNWIISHMFDLLNEALSPEDLSPEDVNYIKEQMTSTFNSSH